LSGGIDSSTVLAVAKSEGYELYALTFDYNQRHRRELESARLVASSLGVKKHLIIRFDLGEIGGSALTSETEVPKNRIQKTAPPHPLPQGKGASIKIPYPSPCAVSFTTTRGERGEGKGGGESLGSELYALGSVIPVTYVPARNTIFLSFAVAWAEVLYAMDIFIGANVIDYSGYPDCRPKYIKAFEDMANLATKASVEGRLRFTIRAPLISMKKSEIIRKGIDLGLDYSLTWSCYDPQPATAGVQSSMFKVQSYKGKNTKLKIPNSKLITCGLCDSCVFRAKGFKVAGIKDPLINTTASLSSFIPP
jgi:7-cyano-7-deazaguanine synthase